MCVFVDVRTRVSVCSCACRLTTALSGAGVAPLIRFIAPHSPDLPPRTLPSQCRFQSGHTSSSTMNPLDGYVPQSSQPPPFYYSSQSQAPSSFLNPSPLVMPLSIRPPPKVQPVFSTLPMAFKPVQLSSNNAAYSSVGTAFLTPPSPVVAPALPANPAAAPLMPLTPAMTTAMVPVRDSTWLKMRVCPSFFKEVVSGNDLLNTEKCPFTAETCSLAHPQPNVRIENGNVTVCFDFIKRSDCRHSNCKYYHPPKHHTEAVLKRGDMTKKISASQGPSVPTTSLTGLCWPSNTMGQSPLMLNPAAQTNPAMALAMLSAMRGTGVPSASIYSPVAASAAAAALYSAFPDQANLNSLLAGYYPFSVPSASPSANTAVTSAYNPAEFFSGGVPVTTSLFSPGGLLSPSAYAAAVAAVTACQQAGATATAIPALSAPSQLPISVSRSDEDVVPSCKRTASSDKDALTNIPRKRIHNAIDDNTHSNPIPNHVVPVSNQSQLANSLVFNAWLQQQQQQHQLSSPPPPSLPTATSPTVALQTAALMRLQQQRWAAMTAGYGSLTGLTSNSTAAYSNPTALFDPLAFQSAGVTANPYAMNLLQSQTLLTNVAYINDEGQLLESLPICRDFKAGKCHRSTDCRYVHLIDENVEVNQGRVTVCRDAAKGRCARVPCKYYHIPLLAISASRSLALNSALSAAAATNNFSSTVVSPTTAKATASASPTHVTNSNPIPPTPSSNSASL